MAQTLGIAAYTSHGHVLVSPGGTVTGIVDRALKSAGASRRVVVAVPYFLAALATVAHTDLLATVPRRVAHCHARSFGLGMAPPPIPIRTFPVQLIWSRRTAVEPAMLWLRNRVIEVTKGIAALQDNAEDVRSRAQPVGHDRDCLALAGARNG